MPWTLLLILTGAALLLRLLRLPWQPLWWDEGYSIYFATEPLGRMLDLTARDIHPPLYYALLHGWALLFGPGPVSVRVLSALVAAAAIPAIAWLAQLLFPQQRAVLWLSAILLAVNPMHLYYSQEVRMYGLALTLSVLATCTFWRLVQRIEEAPGSRPQPTMAWHVLWYVLSAVLALHTLYYTALLLAAHAIWAAIILRRRLWPHMIVAWTGTILLYLPWLIYATPRLVSYVTQKVQADQDKPLGLGAYLVRHLSAFLTGHVTPSPDWTAVSHVALWTAGGATVLLLLTTLARGRAGQNRLSAPVGALYALLVIPTLAAFLLNLRLPFLPTGGERLLLIVLPWLLLLLSAGAVYLWQHIRPLAAASLALITLAAATGIGIFFTTPRYVDEDYRPLIRRIVQQGNENDTVIAIFPWMIGYWRAYTPANLNGPQPSLLSNDTLEYGPAIEATLAEHLSRGTLWFPEPLGFGSDLPLHMEAWLQRSARSIENQWQSDTTRLTAWSTLHAPGLPEARPSGADFGGVQLAQVASAGSAAAGGAPLPINLLWQGDPDTNANLIVSLRLLDGEGRIWALRDYEFTAHRATAEDGKQTDAVGLLIPAGTPPGQYRLFAGVGQGIPPNKSRLLPIQNAAPGTLLAPLGDVKVILPEQAPSLDRLPIQPLPPIAGRRLQMAGAMLPGSEIPAGGSFALDIYAFSQVESPPLADLGITLQARNGSSRYTWTGWPLSSFPTAAWPQGYPVRVPVAFYLPADLAPGQYDLSAAWLDPASNQSETTLHLGRIQITQRQRTYVEPTDGVELAPSPTFGTHARLHSYTLQRNGDMITLGLTWEVLQPLLPPHHVFVHADIDASNNPAGLQTIAQADGPPESSEGPAPTGTWLAGEYLTTTHTLTLPANGQPITLRVGLYDPQTLVRLPVTTDGAPAGDAFELLELEAP